MQIFGHAWLLWLRMLFCVEGVPPSNRGQDARDTNRSHTLLSVRLPEFSTDTGWRPEAAGSSGSRVSPQGRV